MTQPNPTGLQAVQEFRNLTMQAADALWNVAKGKPLAIDPITLNQRIYRLRPAVDDFLKPPFVTKQEVREILEASRCVISDSHLVYKSGRHGSKYVNKDGVYPDTQATSRLCRGIAEHFSEVLIDVVVAPEKGGIILSQWVAFHLSEVTGRKVFAAYAEKNEVVVLSTDSDRQLGLFEVKTDHDEDDYRQDVASFSVKKGSQVVVRNETFNFKRGYGSYVSGRKALVVEDILTTGGSAKRTVDTTRDIGGEVVGVGAVCNRGVVTAEQVGNVPELFSLMNIIMDSWSEEECPLCAKGVPVNTDLGHGKEFLARQKQAVS